MSTSRSLPGMIQAGLSKTEEISSRDTEKSNVHVYEDLEVLEKKLKDDSIIADLMEDNDWGEEDDKLDRDDMEDGDGEGQPLPPRLHPDPHSAVLEHVRKYRYCGVSNRENRDRLE